MISKGEANFFLKEYNENIPLDFKIAEKQEEQYGSENSFEKTGRRIEGAYHPKRKIFTLATPNIHNQQHLRTIIRHEIIGHYGLNTFKPSEKMDQLALDVADKAEEL